MENARAGSSLEIQRSGDERFFTGWGMGCCKPISFFFPLDALSVSRSARKENLPTSNAVHFIRGVVYTTRAWLEPCWLSCHLPTVAEIALLENLVTQKVVFMAAESAMFSFHCRTLLAMQNIIKNFFSKVNKNTDQRLIGVFIFLRSPQKRLFFSGDMRGEK